MNIGKSIKIALAQRGKNGVWLADSMGVTKQQVSHLVSKNTANGATIQRLADVFNLKPSEFIALGEQEYD